MQHESWTRTFATLARGFGLQGGRQLALVRLWADELEGTAFGVVDHELELVA
jgi:hypothetical protein